jgi:hypothetical protein
MQAESKREITSISFVDWGNNNGAREIVPFFSPETSISIPSSRTQFGLRCNRSFDLRFGPSCRLANHWRCSTQWLTYQFFFAVVSSHAEHCIHMAWKIEFACRSDVQEVNGVMLSNLSAKTTCMHKLFLTTL